MARKRPGIVAVRRIIAGMCLFLGLFVACFGLGNGQQSVLVVGVAIMVLALSARVATSFRRTPRQWIRGTGLVVEVSEPPAEARLGRCSLQLLLDVPGMPNETVVVHDSRVPAEQWPKPGQQLPIQVAADDIRNVRVLWRDFTPVEMPLDAAWGDDQPGPAPITPPGSHLDPSPVIDFDLDHPPTGPLEPKEPLGPDGTTTTADEAGPADVRRIDAGTPVTESLPGEGPPGGDPASGAAGPAASASPAVAAGGNGGLATVTAGAGSMVPRPRPRPSPRPRPIPAKPPAPDGHPTGGGPTGAIHGLGVTVLVTELGRSVDFYRDQLGFREIDGGEGTTVLATGGTRVVLRQASDIGAVRHRLVHLNLEVDDIDEVYAALKASGVRFTYPPRAVDQTTRLQLWAAAFRDPDGHGIALTQWRPTSTPSA